MRRSFHKLFLSFILILSAVTNYFIFVQYLPSEKQLHRNALFDRARTVLVLFGDSFTRAMRNRDDISVLTQVEAIMKLEDIYTVYILDKNRKVLTHDKTSEWDKVYTDNTALKAVEAEKILRQKTAYGYLFSMPLSTSATLCVGMSSQKVDRSMLLSFRKAFVTMLIALLAAAGAFIFFARRFIFNRLNSLKAALDSFALESADASMPDSGQDDEFSDIFRLVKDRLFVFGKDRKVSESDKVCLSLNEITGVLVKMYTGGVMVLDGNNKVFFMNSKAEEFLGLDPGRSAGKHVLELIHIPPLLALIKKAAEQSGLEHAVVIEGRPVKAAAVSGADGISRHVIVTF